MTGDEWLFVVAGFVIFWLGRMTAAWQIRRAVLKGNARVINLGNLNHIARRHDKGGADGERKNRRHLR